MNPLHSARFELSCADFSALPPTDKSEIAFVGRSNAGKSSALNALVGKTRLAFVSRTPGRTQLINRFILDSGAALVDLPGYGFAQAPLHIRQEWSRLCEHFLELRTNCVALVLVMDVRRPFSKLDLLMVRAFTGRVVYCLLTKADKLSRSAQMQALAQAKAVAKGLPEVIELQLFSARTGLGLDTARKFLHGLLIEPQKYLSPATQST